MTREVGAHPRTCVSCRKLARARERSPKRPDSGARPRGQSRAASAAGNDDRATKLRDQLDALRAESAALRAKNALTATEVEALRTDPAAIESHARDELGMVYPGELVLRLEDAP